MSAIGRRVAGFALWLSGFAPLWAEAPVMALKGNDEMTAASERQQGETT